MSSSPPTPTTKIRTSSLPRSLPSTTPLAPSTHDTLSTALLEANAIPAIEKVLSQSLAEAGWTADLRAYIQKLVRSGECANYAGIMRRVMEAMNKGEAGLGVPEKVVREGVKVVRGELDRVVVVVVDD